MLVSLRSNIGLRPNPKKWAGDSVHSFIWAGKSKVILGKNPQTPLGYWLVNFGLREKALRRALPGDPFGGAVAPWVLPQRLNILGEGPQTPRGGPQSHSN